MLNTLYIRTFLAVVEAGNYTLAADLLHMSQPAVSQHIRALEEQLGGVRLFRRAGQKMLLTHAGSELLAAARELVQLVERTEQHIRALRGQVAGRVVIGCTNNSSLCWLPPLMAPLRQRYPALQLSVRVASYDILLHEMETQQADVLLLAEPQRRRGWQAHCLGSERIVLLAPPAHPLVQQPDVVVGMLREHALLLPPVGAPLRRTIEDGLRRSGVPLTELHIALESDSMLVLQRAVHAGLGLAFVPACCLSLLPGSTLVELAAPALQQDWYVLRAREQPGPRAVHEVYELLTSPESKRLLVEMGLLAMEAS